MIICCCSTVFTLLDSLLTDSSVLTLLLLLILEDSLTLLASLVFLDGMLDISHALLFTDTEDTLFEQVAVVTVIQLDGMGDDDTLIVLSNDDTFTVVVDDDGSVIHTDSETGSVDVEVTVDGMFVVVVVGEGFVVGQTLFSLPGTVLVSSAFSVFSAGFSFSASGGDDDFSSFSVLVG